MASEELDARIYTSNQAEALNYRIYVPEPIEAGKKYPLILFLHGAGERGSDNKNQLKHGVSELLSFSKESGQSAIIIAPQCPQDMQWVDTPWGAGSHKNKEIPTQPMKLVMELLQKTLKERPVDPQRIYVTGLSMGGFGTWDIMFRQPDLFAAAMPVCGGGDVTQSKAIKHIPVWIFHGSDDSAVKVKRSRDMVTALKKVGGSPRYTEYAGVGHNSWSRAYADRDALKWLFSQKKTRNEPVCQRTEKQQ